MLAAARKDEKKEEALKNHVGHPITGRDCAFTLLNSPISHTQYPYVTGTSVLGIKYKDGVLLASDMGGSYGSTLRYKSVQRLKPIGKHTLLGAGGEISDFQEIIRYLDELILYDNMWDDGNSLGPKEVHNYLNRLMYNRRNKFNPLWNTLILGGVKNGQKYLGTVNMIGVHYEESHVATGFGNHLARPIFRDEWHEDMTFEEGVKLLEKCMLVLLYRDRSAVNKLQLESALRASEIAQYALRKERENTRAAIYTNEEFSSLQCQELRDRLQNVQLEIEQLRKSVREKDIELDVAQKELEMQKKETGRWENRVYKLLEKHKSIDVEHYEHIKFELQLIQC